MNRAKQKMLARFQPARPIKRRDLEVESLSPMVEGVEYFFTIKPRPGGVIETSRRQGKNGPVEVVWRMP